MSGSGAWDKRVSLLYPPFYFYFLESVLVGRARDETGGVDEMAWFGWEQDVADSLWNEALRLTASRRCWARDGPEYPFPEHFLCPIGFMFTR